MKIALIQCPVWGTYDPPVGLAQLSSCLKKAGHSVSVLDLNIKLYLQRKEKYKNMWAWEQCLFWYEEKEVNKFFEDNSENIENYVYVKDIMDTRARIIGFSVNAASRLSSIEMAKRFKKRDKDLIIVFGGPLFFEKKYIDFVLNGDTVDIVIPGEGEITFCEVISLIEKGEDITFCKGIAFKKNEKIITTAPRELLKDLDSLPFLDFTDLPLSDYDDSRHIPFMASRGCIQKCVFCSSRTFWPGYRAMSGERIFKEIEYHKRREGETYPHLGHVNFLDLLFNGNMKSLIDFCELMSRARLEIHWTANMIIRPEMNREVIKKMKEARCEHIIFGIESGSQRVLELMKKHYRIEDADRIIRLMHEEGITTTCNFMFGLPGERKTDFQKTLDFIKRNANFIDRAYPSRTYCAIEEYSYFHAHPEEFGIQPNSPNHLYWESIDGENTYPLRLERCEDFCNLASSLGIEVGCGVQTSVEMDKYFNLGFYYEFKKDYPRAIDCFLKYNSFEPFNKTVNDKINFYYQEVIRGGSEVKIDKSMRIDLRKAITKIKEGEKEMPITNSIIKLGREQSLALLKQRQEDNSRLNDNEFESRRIELDSSPKAIFLQAAGPCNSNCTFCSRGSDYELFDLQKHCERFEEKLGDFLLKAEQIILTGSGEFLLLPEAEKILDYFNDNFPQAEKMFSTNGSSLAPNICEKIVYSKSKYTIHLSLHSSNSRLHKVITRSESFHKIVGQLNHLLRLRRYTANPAVYLIFVATTLNIEDLPHFVRLAANLGVNKVICYYNYIYIPAQKYLSCFFKQELTNKMFDEAERLAQKLNVKIELPPRFGLKDYPISGICREPWSQIMLNVKGYVLPCDASEDTNEGLDGKNFVDVWNSPYYKNLRKSLIEGNCACFKHCFRANPSSVNDFRSHVIHRGIKGRDIDILWGDNF